MIEWSFPVVHRLETTLGNLRFNDATQVSPVAEGSLYLLDPNRCSAQRTLRVTSDPVPQGDGEILHARFADGCEETIVVQFWIKENEPACFADARLMAEELHKNLQAILNGQGRWFWQPSDYGDERMFDEARWLAPLQVSLGEGGVFEGTFQIDTPFPYMLDKTQTNPTISGSSTLTNSGNAPFWPVIQVSGGNNFTISDDDNGFAIVYDSSLPGALGIGGGYAEIDTFRNTIYLNGSGANLKAGIDVLNTDFWPLNPGTTNVTVSGASAEFLLNNAWLPA